MPDNLPTIADAIADRLDLADIEVSDLRNDAPLVAILPGEESSDGTTHKYSKEVAAPVVGFRNENQGREFGKDGDELVTVNLKILDWSNAVDKAVADSWRKGGPEAYVSRKGFRHLKSALFTYEQQIIYGAAADAAGFVGLVDVFDLITPDGMVVDGGGSEDLTSVWALRLGEADFCGVYKGDGIADIGETIVQNHIVDGKNLPVYYTPACTWLAVQLGSAFSVGRLANLGERVSQTPGSGLDDEKIYDLLSRFLPGKGPTHIVMNRRSLRDLRNSRTATNATGAPAPPPTEIEGIPIVVTDSLINDEAALQEDSLSD